MVNYQPKVLQLNKAYKIINYPHYQNSACLCSDSGNQEESKIGEVGKQIEQEIKIGNLQKCDKDSINFRTEQSIVIQSKFELKNILSRAIILQIFESDNDSNKNYYLNCLLIDHGKILRFVSPEKCYIFTNEKSILDQTPALSFQIDFNSEQLLKVDLYNLSEIRNYARVYGVDKMFCGIKWPLYYLTIETNSDEELENGNKIQTIVEPSILKKCGNLRSISDKIIAFLGTYVYIMNSYLLFEYDRKIDKDTNQSIVTINLRILLGGSNNFVHLFKNSHY